MTTPLIALSKLTNYASIFSSSAIAAGFSSSGEIDRFLFKSYGQAVRKIPPANRPQGAIFFLEPPSSTDALAKSDDLKPVLLKIRTEVDSRFYSVPLDLVGGAKVALEPTCIERRLMASGAWTSGYAQILSRQTKRCVVWANGVSATVYINGDCYLETPDVIEEIPSGLPCSFQSLSWNDGEIVFQFAQHELNDTSPAGIWQLPDQWLLRSKPEKLMSTSLGKFLRLRMAGYKHHDDEPYVENQGRADISLILYNGFAYIIEVKWVGCAITGTKQLNTENVIKAALKDRKKGWTTEYGDKAFESGARQLAHYFGTGKYKRAYLMVFDCKKQSKTRKDTSQQAEAAHVTPYNPEDFRIVRACVDPRKASIVSKANQP